MTRMTTACPYCDGIRIVRNADGAMKPGKSGWYCRECEERFDEPQRREARANGGIRDDTLAGRLADPDVTEVSDLEEVPSP